MRKSYVQINGVLYERGKEPLPEGHMIIEDIKPYQSQITGEWIPSRSQHREHLKAHGCVEIGDQTRQMANWKPNYDVNPQHRKELIRAQVDAMSNAEFKRALRRDTEYVKWNSRGLPRATE